MTSSKNNDPGINEEMSNVCRDVVSDPVWRHLLDETARVLESFDAGISEEVDFVQSDSTTLHRMVRYCLPVQELHQALDGASLDPQSLASLFLWQEAWRPLDNLLDSDGKITTNLREYNYRLLRAWSFHQNVYPKSSLMERFLTCLNTTLQIEDDVEARIDPARTYQRVSLYEVPFTEIPSLSEKTIDFYRTYVNAIGVAHDFGDVVKDSASGTHTFATEVLRSADEHSRLNASHFAKLRDENVSAFGVFSSKFQHPVLDECWITNRNMSAFYNWAFKS